VANITTRKGAAASGRKGATTGGHNGVKGAPPEVVPPKGKTKDIVLSWISLVARLILGGAIFYAGIIKLPDMSQSVTAVKNYQILPVGWMTQTVGYALPLVEVLLGLAIILGVFTRWTSLLGAIMMVVYIAAIISLWIRGININCGCFSPPKVLPDDAANAYLQDILRDIGLLACGVFAFLFPASPISIDKWIAGNDLKES